MYFQLKTNSVGITEVSVVPMANNMYFIQWIMTSYYQDIDYIEMILCASKLHVFNLVLIFCPDPTDVAKSNYVVMNIL